MEQDTFESRTTHYRPQNARLLAQAALLAYQTPDVIQPLVAQWGLDRFSFIDRGETQAYLAGNNEMILISYRGTEPDNLKDWMTDAKIRRVKGPYGKVHRGFLKGLIVVLPKIRSVIETWQVHAQSLWLTGHSLGAALATLTAATFGEEAKPVHGIYTFGQPRVGGKTFARNFDQDFRTRTFLFVNNHDLFTRVLQRLLVYRHVGQTLVFDVSGKLQTDLHFWNHFLDRVAGRIEDLGKPGTDGVKDHNMGNYLRLLDLKENQKVTVV